MAIRFETASADETEQLAQRCAELLGPGDVVFVAGGLGAGKTTFVRGACRGLGVTDAVTSPTYTIGQLYAGPVPVAHVDLYRLDTLEPEDPALLDDYATADRVCFVEWPQLVEDRYLEIGKVKLTVEIDFPSTAAANARVLSFRGEPGTLAAIEALAV